MTQLEQLLYNFRGELGGEFISTEVVGMDGISIAGGSLDPNYDANEISARFAEVMKLAIKISTRIDIGKVEDNLVTTGKTYIITRLLGDSSYFWVVVANSGATLGTLRMLMKEYTPQILQAIPLEAASPLPAEAEEKMAAPALQEESKKEKKSRRINFWADAKKDNGDDANDKDKPSKVFMFP